MNKHYLGILATLLIFCSFTFADTRYPTLKGMKLTDLTCEYAKNPMGLDIKAPQFAWCIESSDRGILQSAYQIIVTDSEPKSDNGSLIWDSGKVQSSQSAGIAYKGPSLCSRQRYYWKLRIWDSKGQSAVSDGSDYFEMGLMNQEDWEAEWIGMTSTWHGRVKYYRCEFSLEEAVEKARVYISGMGLYELHLNGEKVGNRVLEPSVSTYSKRILYSTYDITGLLKKKNVFGVIVGPGFYSEPKLKLQAEIVCADGSVKKILTHKLTPYPGYSWQLTIGPVIQSSIYDGELYDAREEKKGWDKPGPLKNIDRNNRWYHVYFLDSPGGKMVSQKHEPIQVMDTLTPVSISEPSPGIYVADAGRNIAGWAAIRVQGDSGTRVSLRFAESLYEDGTVNQENLLLALAKDQYILKGNGMEHWEPRFTYHGFRYVQIEGYPYRPEPEDIKIKVVRTALAQTGKFSCSNDLLNQIHTLVVNTEASNIHGVPTDCPQRNERFGWLNDMTVRTEQALYNFNCARFYAKFIEDIGDTQKKDGSIGDTAPFKGGTIPADPVSASYLLLARKSYDFYGNEMIIRRNYDQIKAWVDYLHSLTKDGILTYSRWGDWAPPVEYGINGGPRSRNTPGELMSTGYFYYSCHMLSQMAGIIGREKDEQSYRILAEKTARAFNEKFWDEKAGGYGSNNQACNAFALFLEIVDQERIPLVVENLVNNVKAHDYHLTTGNLCTKYLLEVLTEHGQIETAYRIATQESYPSWGYMLANGATTLWERWEKATGSGMNSHNHPMLGSVDSWMYKYLLGITPDDRNPGFARFTIRPCVPKDLESAGGEFRSVRGMIKSSWKKQKGRIQMEITIPANSIARVYVPTSDPGSISESNKAIGKDKGIRYLSLYKGYAIFEVGSGEYSFSSKFK